MISKDGRYAVTVAGKTKVNKMRIGVINTLPGS